MSPLSIVTTKKAGKKPRPASGPSCESCHGASSNWIKVHNDYGGPNAKKADETATHKAERLKKAAAAGMIWSFDHYGIAENCMSCHGLNNAALDGKTLAAMLDAEHPLNPDFELVKYSQGSVRHCSSGRECRWRCFPRRSAHGGLSARTSPVEPTARRGYALRRGTKVG